MIQEDTNLDSGTGNGIDGRIEALVRAAIDAGATMARGIDSSSIVVDPRVRLKCLVPLCPSYARNLMCPPNVPPVQEFAGILERYRRAVIIQVEVRPEEEGQVSPESAYEGSHLLHRVVNEVEKRAFEMGFPLAAGLIGGTCRLCSDCVAKKGGRDCRHPFKARPSMEAMGIDVLSTTASLGLRPSFPIPSSVIWTGCVLLD